MRFQSSCSRDNPAFWLPKRRASCMWTHFPECIASLVQEPGRGIPDPLLAKTPEGANPFVHYSNHAVLAQVLGG